MRSSDLWDRASASARASPNRSKFFVIRSASGADLRSAAITLKRASNTAIPEHRQDRETYYHLDATFDNSLGKCLQTGEEIRYDYFNLDDKAIFRDHEPLIAPAPACTDSDHFYYKEKKLSFTKQEDVYKRSLQAAKKGKTLTFHWRGGYLTKEVLRELLDLIEKAGKERQKTALIKLNWPQAVLRVRYTDEAIQPIVTMEEANEGEETPEGTASL